MKNSALPATHSVVADTLPVRLIADLARLVVPGDRTSALALAGAR
jgi:hypothetical protein